MSSPDRPNPSRQAQLALTVGALGVVFGDIGTSPLYALRECLLWLGPVDRTEGVLGALSLIFWALCFEVGVKYLGFVTRADNRGEGGIFALRAGLVCGTFILVETVFLLANLHKFTDVGALCEELKARGVPLKPQEVTFYFNREMIVSGGNARMWEWQKSLYAFLSRNARPVKDYYKVLPTQVIEIGLPVQL